MSCETLLEERNALFYGIVDVLPVNQSTELFNQDEPEILETILGAVNNYVTNMEPDIWVSMMYCIAKLITPIYNKFKSVLIDNKYNFDY